MALLDSTHYQSARVPNRSTGDGQGGGMAHAVARRAHLAGRAAVMSVTSFLGIPVFTLWVVFVATSPLTLVAPLVIPATLLIRAYANANRRAAGNLLGERIDAPYRPAGDGLFGRVITIVRDPASWRDAWWAVSHVIVGAFLSILSLALLAGSILHLIYPFLYAITPQSVFGRPYNLFDLDSVGESFVMVPIGAVTLLIWWFAAVPLARAEAAYTRSLLR